MTEADTARPAATRALDRGLALLTILAQAPSEGLSAPTLAQSADLSRATAYRLLQTLTQRGFVTLDEQTRRYHLGSAFDRWLMGADSQMALSTVAGPTMRRLSEFTGESVGLQVRSGWERMVINKVEPDDQPLRYVINVHTPRALGTGASGAVLLSRAPEDDVREAAAQAGAEDVLTATDRLRSRIEFVRENGYAHAREDTVPGLASLVAPVHSGNGRVVAALTLSGPIARFGDKGRAEALPQLLASAEEISQAIVRDDT